MRAVDAFYEAAAWFDLSSRGRISASGEDRKRLLHAMTTNHVEGLEVGRGLYAFFLNAQGRVLADVVVLCRETGLLLMLEPEVRQTVYEHLDRYIIADDVTLEDLSDGTCEIAVEGPDAGEVLRAMGLEEPEQEYSFVLSAGVTVVRCSATGAEGVRLIFPSPERERIAAALRSAGAVEASEDDVKQVRLAHGRPRYGEDITDGYIAHETRQLHAVHFEKGCYLGQEIVERVRSRGQVNRLLTPLRIEGRGAPAAGDSILSGETACGVVTSAAYCDREGEVRALGYVRAQALSSGTPLSVQGKLAEVVQ